MIKQQIKQQIKQENNQLNKMEQVNSQLKLMEPKLTLK